ncbi:hypothetical protein [Methylobacterium sp. WL7]|uniref:hypothetical protein n=1 Tax=Methylobacterium sp. WL7 TaxID=2603900 RepID=UPI0011C86274|nr:hypothetical protein [Methylobacterium sp. WL7]TXN42375.1 hypothetical protein FV233_23095 [Methylobacterium sp. WL7]
MNEILIAGLRASARDFHTAGEAMLRGAERLETLAGALERAEHEAAGKPAGAPVYKKPNGRMTEAGVAAIDAAFAAGSTVTQVAEQFEIHTSAASYRHARFLETQKGNPSA